MNKAQAIYAWLRANPGYHFASDILSGLGLKGKERYSYAWALKNCAALGKVERLGSRKMTRYKIAGEPS